MQDETCVHVCTLYKKDTTVGTLMWVCCPESEALVLGVKTEAFL